MVAAADLAAKNARPKPGPARGSGAPPPMAEWG
jgi:hypothetical protein